MRYDSIIFDMDGTLWDAVDSYAAIWNKTVGDCGTEREPVTRKELICLMGKPLREIAALLVPGLEDEELAQFFDTLEANDLAMMPVLGGRLYPGVEETLGALKDMGLKLFMVSNCGPEGLPMFLDYTGLRPYFTDWLSYGSTGADKDVNIRALCERYKLSRPLYAGDTAGDLSSTRKAGAEFAWAAYGFGTPEVGEESDVVLNCIRDLIEVVKDNEDD